MSVIKFLKRSHADSRLITIIVRELGMTHMLIPTSCKVDHISPEYILKDLVDPFGLPIRLRIISGAKMQSDPQCLFKTPPKLRCKSGVSVLNNRNWDAVQSHYLLNEHLSKPVHRPGSAYWNEISQLCQTIDDNPDGIVITLSPR